MTSHQETTQIDLAIYQEIKKVDDKHTENYKELHTKMGMNEVFQERFLEGQREQTEQLKALNGSLSKLGERVMTLEHKNQQLASNVENMKGTIKAKSTNWTAIVTTSMTVAGGIIVGVLGFIRLFFE